MNVCVSNKEVTTTAHTQPHSQQTHVLTFKQTSKNLFSKLCKYAIQANHLRVSKKPQIFSGEFTPFGANKYYQTTSKYAVYNVRLSLDTPTRLVNAQLPLTEVVLTKFG